MGQGLLARREIRGQWNTNEHVCETKLCSGPGFVTKAILDGHRICSTAGLMNIAAGAQPFRKVGHYSDYGRLYSIISKTEF
jgi:hypothetical protein